MNKKTVAISLIMLILIGMIFLPNYSNASNDIIVMLDPGHGGSDVGATADGIYESDVNWKIAKRVKEILDGTPGITGILTRTEGENPSLYDRGIMARDNNADLLVSFHINSTDSVTTVSGAEVYITANTNQKRYYEYSNVLGLDILSELRNVGVTTHIFKPIIRPGQPNEWYEDGFVADYYGIIRNPMYYGIPGVLIEHCYINNPSDRTNYLSSDEKINAMAEADAKAIIANKELFRREYYGNINTDLKTMEKGTEADGRNYITGEILIAEWINGVACVPKDLPKMQIKATDGSIINGVNLVHNGGLSYSYYRIIDNLDIQKEYYLEVELTTPKNLSTSKTQKVRLAEMTIGKYKDTELKTKNDKLYFATGGYIGAINTDLKEIQLNKNEAGNYYISGNMLIAEWIDGVANIPKSLPKLTLKTTDGTSSIPMYIAHLEGLSYYYDVFIDRIDRTKQYYIEAELTSEENKGTNKTKKVILPEKKLGTMDEKTIVVEDNLIKPLYNGVINAEIKTIELGQNEIGRNYIAGKIIIEEIVDGVTCEPDGLPEMTIKATDGSYSTGIHVVHNEGVSYSYDRIIDNLDVTKEYEIEVKLISKNNISENIIQIAKLPNKEVGKYGTVKLIAEDNKLKMVDPTLYVGAINTDLKTMYVDINEVGREYIHGNILIAEWIEGVACEPNGLPELTLKSTDGTYSAEMHVSHLGGLNYYYDRVIFNLDTSKEYYIEAKLTGNKNIGPNKVQKANLNVVNTIGQFKEKNILVQNNKIFFKGNEYEGAINTDLKTMYLDINEVGREYIHGNILIAEWIDGVACVPNSLPEMTLKSTDGTYSAGMHVSHEGGLNYYYDRVVFNLDTSKEYYIEVKLTNANNISPNKVQKANMQPNEEVGIFKEATKIVLKDNMMIFEELEAMILTFKVEETTEEIQEKEIIEEDKNKEEIIENKEEVIEEQEKVQEETKVEQELEQEDQEQDESIQQENSTTTNNVNVIEDNFTEEN